MLAGLFVYFIILLLLPKIFKFFISCKNLIIVKFMKHKILKEGKKEANNDNL